MVKFRETAEEQQDDNVDESESDNENDNDDSESEEVVAKPKKRWNATKTFACEFCNSVFGRKNTQKQHFYRNHRHGLCANKFTSIECAHSSMPFQK